MNKETAPHFGIVTLNDGRTFAGLLEETKIAGRGFLSITSMQGKKDMFAASVITRIQPKTEAEILADHSEPASIAQIVETVAAWFKVQSSQILSKDRSHHIVVPRHVGMLLARDAGYSSTVIGEAFGGKDHTTVLNAIQKIKRRSDVYVSLKQSIRDLRDQLRIPEVFELSGRVPAPTHPAKPA